MTVPLLRGTIRRRILVNFRVAPEAARLLLPAPFAPKLVHGFAVAGVCLIRLEQLRPAGVPAWLGVASENAAHRVAVTWDEAGQAREGVYIPRRDSASWLNRVAGGRVFPGAHGAAAIDVRDDGRDLVYALRARDGLHVALQARTVTDVAPGSVFATLDEASAFFAGGAAGYSPGVAPRGAPGVPLDGLPLDGLPLDGLRLVTETFPLAPLAVDSVRASFFADPARFPPGSVAFDSAFVMRDVTHAWQPLPAPGARGSSRAESRKIP